MSNTSACSTSTGWKKLHVAQFTGNHITTFISSINTSYSWDRLGHSSPFFILFFSILCHRPFRPANHLYLRLSHLRSTIFCPVFFSPYYFPVQPHRGITQPHLRTPMTLIAVPAGGNRRYVT